LTYRRTVIFVLVGWERKVRHLLLVVHVRHGSVGWLLLLSLGRGRRIEGFWIFVGEKERF